MTHNQDDSWADDLKSKVSALVRTEAERLAGPSSSPSLVSKQEAQLLRLVADDCLRSARAADLLAEIPDHPQRDQ